MIKVFSILVIVVSAFLFVCCAEHYEFEVADTTGMRWYKGNTHTHTNMSDGDSPPEVVAQWYKDHGYQFLVLSDHNVFVDPQRLSEITDSTFVLIPGEEITTRVKEKRVHINGLNIPGLIEPHIDSTVVETIQQNVDAVRGVRGVPHINHPNFRWSISAEDIFKVKNDRLLEIFNGHPLVHNLGGGDWPGMEEVWDQLLTRGKTIYGIAVDDAHHFQGEFSAQRSNPGRGWVAVRAHSLDPAEIVRNLDNGLFYASTGVVLEDIVIAPNRIEIRIHVRGDFKYRTQFIGRGGKILLETGDNPAIFILEKKAKYVRAKVTDSGGAMAWVQPVFVKSE